MKTLSTLMLGLAIVAAPLAAHADGQYQTIDSVNRRGDTAIAISGVLVGDSTSTPSYISNSSSVSLVDACERGALLMMAHPGRYLLSMYATNNGCTLTPAPAPTPAKTN